MKRIFLRDIPAEMRFARAMWHRAQGVPAEERIRHRLRAIGLVVQAVLSRFVMALTVFWLAAIVTTTSYEAKLWFMFFVSLIASGWLIIRVGRGLLLPRDGLILAHSPVSNRQVLRHEFWALPLQLLLMALGAWLFFSRCYPPSLAGFAVYGWMLVPLLGIGWQCLRRGRAGSFLLWVGSVGFVCFLILAWLEETFPRLTPFDEAFTQVEWLPSNWLFSQTWGALLAGGCLSFSVLAVRKRMQQFRLRATPGAQVGSVAVESDIEPAGVETVAETVAETVTSLKANVWRRPHLVTRTCQLFWNEEERALGADLFYGYSQARFWQWTGFMVFLVAFWWLPYFVSFEKEDPGLENWLSLIGPLVVAIILMVVWRSVILVTAFSKFALPGDRFVALVASMPISEKILFRMYLKEGLVGFLLIVPLQLLLIWMVMNRMGFEMIALDWVLIFLTISGLFVVKKLGSWTGMLWHSMRFFQPGFRGDFKTSFFRLVYFLPIFPITFALFIYMGRWTVVREFPAMALLALVGGTLWTFGGCWLVRRLYAQGKGSVVVSPVKRKSFRLR